LGQSSCNWKRLNAATLVYPLLRFRALHTCVSYMTAAYSVHLCTRHHRTTSRPLSQPNQAWIRAINTITQQSCIAVTGNATPDLLSIPLLHHHHNHHCPLSSSCRLQGAPTYRLPHHPKYMDAFENPMYKPIWFKVFGRGCYTHIVKSQVTVGYCWPLWHRNSR